MAAPIWQFVCEKTIKALASHGHWTLAADYVEHPARLLVEVSDQRADAQGQKIANKWHYGGRECSADGDYGMPIDVAKSLVPSAPPAALIGKIGGSCAGRTDGVVTFIIGSYCVFELAEKQRGPLYLTMNTDTGSSLVPAGELLVRISQSA